MVLEYLAKISKELRKLVVGRRLIYNIRLVELTCTSSKKFSP